MKIKIEKDDNCLKCAKQKIDTKAIWFSSTGDRLCYECWHNRKKFETITPTYDINKRGVYTK